MFSFLHFEAADDHMPFKIRNFVTLTNNFVILTSCMSNWLQKNSKICCNFNKLIFEITGLAKLTKKFAHLTSAIAIPNIIVWLLKG